MRKIGWLLGISLLLGLFSMPGNAAAEVLGDVNGDDKVDLREAIYALKVVSGIGGSVTGDFVVLAWNDLGMHCLNPTYDQAVILPPYNTVWAQVIEKNEPPQVTVNGLTVEYGLVNNTYSYGKRSYGQFWDNDLSLFGIDLEIDKGLNLVDPSLHNELSGQMAAAADHFHVDGIPATPVNDSLTWNPYQIAEIKVKNAAGVSLAQTRTTVPTSDEINCAKCHGDNPFQDVLKDHDDNEGTGLQAQTPVLCASCHGSPALGTAGPGSSGKYLSQAIHGSHANRNASCYDCHPGDSVPCSRSLRHTAPDGNCITCHGDMAQVASSIQDGSRTPWVNEPKCADCHTGVAGVDTGTTLYRDAKGHGNIYCAACHGSPHAMTPSSQFSDNYQAIQYQNKAVSIGSCGACHEGSKGEQEDIGEFAEKHGGPNPETPTACNICHTSVSSDTTKWPHAYQWKNR